jgi:hypothetical protein
MKRVKKMGALAMLLITMNAFANDVPSKNSIHKNEFLGYTGCNDKAYRVYGNQTYEILNTTGVYLYKRTFIVSGKGTQMVTAYYFSKDGNSPVELLTKPIKQNMETEYASNTGIRSVLESAFPSDNKTAEYNTNLKCFKVKYTSNGSATFSEPAKKHFMNAKDTNYR